MSPASAPTSSAGDQATADLRQRAFVSHDSGQLMLAELLYREVLGRYPDDWNVARALGILAIQTQRFEWALQLLTELYRVDQGPDVRHYIRTALSGLNRPHEALRYEESAIALAPNSAPAPARTETPRDSRAIAQLEAPSSLPCTGKPGAERAAELAGSIAELGESARIAAETALAATERALAATEHAQWILVPQNGPFGDHVPARADRPTGAKGQRRDRGTDDFGGAFPFSEDRFAGGGSHKSPGCWW